MGKEKGILLSEKFGVNPCMTVCPLCGREANEILLLGHAIEYECNDCGGKIIGKKPKGDCPHCGTFSSYKSLGEFEGSISKRLPASDICDKCKKELKELKEEIAKGGVVWRCSDCKSEGIVKAESEFAKNFSKDHPGMGYEITKGQCPVCTPKEALL